MSTLTCTLNRLQKNLGDWQLKQIYLLCQQHKPLDQTFVSSDIGLEDTSESFGLPATSILCLPSSVMKN